MTNGRLAMSNEDRLVLAWQRASQDLAIEVASPYVLGAQSFPVHVPRFGRKAGALPVLMGDDRDRRVAESRGFFVSLLNPEVYCVYDRETFVETLVEWGWFGSDDAAPTWYRAEVERLTH